MDFASLRVLGILDFGVGGGVFVSFFPFPFSFWYWVFLVFLGGSYFGLWFALADNTVSLRGGPSDRYVVVMMCALGYDGWDH